MTRKKGGAELCAALFFHFAWRRVNSVRSFTH